MWSHAVVPRIETYLRNFSESSAFLAEIDDNTTASILCFFNSLFNAIDQVWTAGTDIGSEHVTAVAL